MPGKYLAIIRNMLLQLKDIITLYWSVQFSILALNMFYHFCVKINWERFYLFLENMESITYSVFVTQSEAYSCYILLNNLFSLNFKFQTTRNPNSLWEQELLANTAFVVNRIGSSRLFIRNYIQYERTWNGSEWLCDWNHSSSFGTLHLD